MPRALHDGPHQQVSQPRRYYLSPNTPKSSYHLPRFDASERALASKWKAYLEWEESNPLEIDRATLITARIQPGCI
jgi:hypothetical protein